MAVPPHDQPIARPGRRLAWRAGVGAVLMVLAVAASVVGVVLTQANAFFDPPGGAPSIGSVGTTKPKPGAPQTILFLGTDERKGADASSTEEARSDTIVLVRLDGKRRVVSLMSIPRDLKVDFPRYGTDKINSAFTRGGAKLTSRTVRRLLSAPGRPFENNHVVQVSFSGFRELVDYLGCSWVDVDRRYFNDVGGPGGYATIDIDPGYQRLCGSDALDYVRYRHTDNDLVRGARQQDFVRQLLHQPQVQDRLSLDNASGLARIAGRYTRLDDSLHETKPVLRLLKLAVNVTDAPVVQVPFGVGRLQDDGSYLTASPDAIEATVDRFLDPRTSSAPRRTGPSKPKAHRRRATRTAGMQDVAAFGKTQAIVQQRKLGFPFAYPRRIPAGGRFVGDQPRRYAIRAAGQTHRAYRTVIDVGGTTGFGQFMGVQGTTWESPPILDGPHDTVTVDGRHLEVFWDGKQVRLVAWRTRNGVYWVSNTLTRTEPYSRMIATARSLTHLR